MLKTGVAALPDFMKKRCNRQKQNLTVLHLQETNSEFRMVGSKASITINVVLKYHRCRSILRSM